LRGNDVPSLLTIHAPGYQSPLLAYIVGDGDFPSIDTSTFLDWQCAFVEGGYLRRYVDQLRELYEGGHAPIVRSVACPLCPLRPCGTGSDSADSVAASKAHALDHLRQYQRTEADQIESVLR
jgi:hypothetical protein